MTGRLGDSATRHPERHELCSGCRRVWRCHSDVLLHPKHRAGCRSCCPSDHSKWRVRMKILWNIDGIHLYDLFHSREVNILLHLDLNQKARVSHIIQWYSLQEVSPSWGKNFWGFKWEKLQFCRPIDVCSFPIVNSVVASPLADYGLRMQNRRVLFLEHVSCMGFRGHSCSTPTSNIPASLKWIEGWLIWHDLRITNPMPPWPPWSAFKMLQGILMDSGGMWSSSPESSGWNAKAVTIFGSLCLGNRLTHLKRSWRLV